MSIPVPFTGESPPGSMTVSGLFNLSLHSSCYGTDLERFTIKHDPIITFLFIRYYFTLRTLKSKFVQQSCSVQEYCSSGKTFARTRTFSCRERHDSLHLQPPVLVQEALWPKTKWILPTIRVVVNCPEINKHGYIPRASLSRFFI